MMAMAGSAQPLYLAHTDDAEKRGTNAADAVTEVEQTRREGGERHGEAEPREDCCQRGCALQLYIQVRSLAKKTLGSTRTGSAIRLPAVRCRRG